MSRPYRKVLELYSAKYTVGELLCKDCVLAAESAEEREFQARAMSSFSIGTKESRSRSGSKGGSRSTSFSLEKDRDISQMSFSSGRHISSNDPADFEGDDVGSMNVRSSSFVSARIRPRFPSIDEEKECVSSVSVVSAAQSTFSELTVPEAAASHASSLLEPSIEPQISSQTPKFTYTKSKFKLGTAETAVKSITDNIQEDIDKALALQTSGSFEFDVNSMSEISLNKKETLHHAHISINVLAEQNRFLVFCVSVHTLKCNFLTLPPHYLSLSLFPFALISLSRVEPSRNWVIRLNTCSWSTQSHSVNMWDF